MTNREKIRLAAERIIDFGLDGTGWTAEELRSEARSENLTIDWSTNASEIVLRVEEHNGAVRLRIEARMGKVSPDSALAVADLIERVARLARNIETAIAFAEYVEREEA